MGVIALLDAGWGRSLVRPPGGGRRRCGRRSDCRLSGRAARRCMARLLRSRGDIRPPATPTRSTMTGLRPTGSDHLFGALHAASPGRGAAAGRPHGAGQGSRAQSARWAPPIAPTCTPTSATAGCRSKTPRSSASCPGLHLHRVESVASLAMPAPRLTQRRGGTGRSGPASRLDDEMARGCAPASRCGGADPCRGGAATCSANCSAPEGDPAALDIFRPCGMPFGAYANGFAQIHQGVPEQRPYADAPSATAHMGPAIYPITSWAGWAGGPLSAGAARPGRRISPRSPAPARGRAATIEEFDDLPE